MSALNLILLALPVVFLIVSVLVAAKAARNGKSKKKTMLMQFASFAAVFAVCLACPLVAGAATGDTAAAADASALAMKYISAAAAIGIPCIGGGIAIAAAAPAAIGATSEDPKAFGKALIFVALGEGIALYGMLIAILILNN